MIPHHPEQRRVRIDRHRHRISIDDGGNQYSLPLGVRPVTSVWPSAEKANKLVLARSSFRVPLGKSQSCTQRNSCTRPSPPRIAAKVRPSEEKARFLTEAHSSSTVLSCPVVT